MQNASQQTTPANGYSRRRIGTFEQVLARVRELSERATLRPSPFELHLTGPDDLQPGPENGACTRSEEFDL